MNAAFKSVVKHLVTKKRAYELGACIIGVLAVAFVALHIDPSSNMYPPHDDALAANSNAFSKASVRTVHKETIEVQFQDGPLKGQYRELPYSTYEAGGDMMPGSTILVRDDGGTLNIYGRWYLPFVIVIVALFLATAALIGRRRGVTSVAGLMASIAVIGLYIIPRLLDGAPAFLTIMSGAFIIAIISVYTAHGVSRRTTISVLAICLVLLVVAGMSQLIIWLGGISGNTGEAAVALAMSNSNIDLQGILAGSIVIATLGILDDVVTTQVATVDKLHGAKPKYSVYELYRHGMDVGREHIAALVNTLALAYIGVSLPLLLIFASGETFNSFLLFFNSAYITQEIVRTVISSLGLVIAVPISTILGAWLIKRWHK